MCYSYYRRSGDYSVCVVVRVLDGEGQTLTVWFDDPHKEYVCEDTGEEVILIKDKAGKVIGFERLNVTLPTTEEKGAIPLEAVSI